MWHFLRCKESPIWNLQCGFGDCVSFLDLARATFSALNLPEQIEFIPTPEKLQAHYQYYTCASLSRLRSSGYNKPMTTLEDGVRLYLKNWET